MKQYLICDQERVNELSELLLTDGGLITPVPFDILSQFTQQEISSFCVINAIYQVPTVELIQFLKAEIGDNRAIEIAAGNGVIGRALNIRMFDNKMQTIPILKDHYENDMNSPTVKYGKDVMLMDGLKAVQKYNPHTVVACWLTHKCKPGEYDNFMGVEEEKLFKNGVKKYIHVGNEKTHSDKPILNIIPHKKYKFPWLLSRSLSPAENVIYIFQNE